MSIINLVSLAVGLPSMLIISIGISLDIRKTLKNYDGDNILLKKIVSLIPWFIFMISFIFVFTIIIMLEVVHLPESA